MNTDAFNHKTLSDGSREYDYYYQGTLMQERRYPNGRWICYEVVANVRTPVGTVRVLDASSRREGRA
jgi:hypothetical protein